jgi:hypothetical protein
MLGLGALAGIGYAVWRAIEANRPEREVGWEPQPFPFPPQPRSAPVHIPEQVFPEGGPEADDTVPPPTTSSAPFTQPIDGACPASHPVKAKLASGIYHVPGGFSYDRTRPDRCYHDAQAAEADGLRAAKR